MEEISKELQSSEGRAIKEYLLMRLEELRSIENIKEYPTDKAQALELKAQKKAYEKLNDIISSLAAMESVRGEVEGNEYSVRQ